MTSTPQPFSTSLTTILLLWRTQPATTQSPIKHQQAMLYLATLKSPSCYLLRQPKHSIDQHHVLLMTLCEQDTTSKNLNNMIDDYSKTLI